MSQAVKRLEIWKFKVFRTSHTVVSYFFNFVVYLRTSSLLFVCFNTIFNLFCSFINKWTTLTDLLCGQLCGSFPWLHKRDVIVRKICTQLLSWMCQILLFVHSAYTRAIIYHEPLRANEEIIHTGNPFEWVWNHIAVQRWILQMQGFATLETHKLPINWMGQLVVGWFKC